MNRQRRALLGALGAIVAAPWVITTPGLLMPVRAWRITMLDEVDRVLRELWSRHELKPTEIVIPESMADAWVTAMRVSISSPIRIRNAKSFAATHAQRGAS